MADIPTGLFIVATVSSGILGVGVAFLLFRFLFKASRPHRQMSAGEPMESELDKVVLRTDVDYVEDAANLMKYLGGNVSYTNKDVQHKLYGIVKGYLPREKLDKAKEHLQKAKYVWDAEIKTSGKEPYRLKVSKEVDLDSSTGKLYSQDRILPSSIQEGHILVIPRFGNPRIQQLYQEAKGTVKDARDARELAERLNSFIHQKVHYEEPDVEEKVLHIDRALEYGGVCKEKAALLQMMLQMFGIESRFRRGKFQPYNERGKAINYDRKTGRKVSGRHAWIEVKAGKEKLIADPTNNLLGNEEDLYRLERVKFVPGKNVVERSRS